MMIDIENDLTIENAENIAKKLRKYLKKADDPLINLSGIEKIDLAGIQLLISVQKSGEQNDKPVLFSGILKKSVYEKLFNNGFNTIQQENSTELYSIRRNSIEL